MKHLGHFSGDGRLKGENGTDFGAVVFEIDMVQLGSKKDGAGRIWGADKELVAASQNVNGLALHLPNGKSVNVVIVSLGNGEAEITTHGPVPGF